MHVRERSCVQNVFAVVDVHGAVEAATISSSALVESFTSLLSLADDIITSDRIIQVPFLRVHFPFVTGFYWSAGVNEIEGILRNPFRKDEGGAALVA